MECRFCGRPTTLLIDGVPVCEECYEHAGSCCLEFGGEDLWQKSEEAPEADHRDSAGRNEPGKQGHEPQ